MKLTWRKFPLLTDARKSFPAKACVYVQTDSEGRPVRVGKASKGLVARYRGGTGYALDAAMHESGNLVFVAGVPARSCGSIESELLWQGRNVLLYNTIGMKAPPTRRVHLEHSGEPPDLSGFEH